MSVSLKKGQKVSLSKLSKVDLSKGNSSGLSKVMVGLGWDPIKKSGGSFLASLFGFDGADYDLDASAFLLKNGRLVSQKDIVYFGRLEHFTGAVQHMGDNLTGGGDGDDEEIFIDFQRLPPEYDRIILVVNIYQANARNQHFGQIKNAFIRIVDMTKRQEMCRFDLSEDYSGAIAMIFGELFKENNEWQFCAIGEGTIDPNLNSLSERYK